MLRATWKSLTARKLRLFLTALSIVLGVGFVAGTYVLTDTMNAAFEDLFSQVSSTSDLVVRSESAFDNVGAGPGTGASEERTPLDESLVDVVAAVPGVRVAVPDVAGTAAIVDPETDEVAGGFGPPTIGTNWNALAEGVLEVREGRPPEADGEVAIDAATAESSGFTVGQTVPVLFETGRDEFEIVGIVGFGEADNLAGATLAVFETETAQRVLGKEGVVDTVTVQAEDGANLNALRQAIQAELPDGAETVLATDVADENAEALQEGLGFFRTALLVFAAVALFVGAFIIFNTFSIIVAQRTRELALLRTLGASRRQVIWSVVLEAAIVGLIASLVGVVAGIGIAIGLQGVLAAFGIDLPTTDTQLQVRTIVVAVIVGMGVTLVASVIPARHAASVAPIQALREPDVTTSRGTRRRRVVVAGIVSVLGVTALVLGLFEPDGSSTLLSSIGLPDNAAVMVGLGAALTLVGVAQLSPFIARAVAGAIGAPFRRRSVPARIGRENAIRNPRRTASTASALMIGLGLVAMVAILAASLKASFDTALRETLKADFTLSTTSFSPFSPDVARQIADLDEVAAASSFRQNGFQVRGQQSFVTGLDPTTVEQVATLDVTEGSLGDLGDNTIAVHRGVADDEGWALGDEVPAAFPSVADRPLEIVAIYEENGIAGDYAIALSTYEDVFVEQLDSFVLVRGADGVASDDVRAAVEGVVADFPNIDVQDQAEFREKQAGFIDQLLGLVTALLFMAIIIALFGIVNTLGLSIYERTRELGLLRAVGMSRRQVKRMIRYESVIIAIFGAILGIVIGIAFGWALQQALEPEGVTQLAIPGGQLVVYFVFAALAGIVAAIWPARRAAKLNVLESIAYE
ncbi:MAG TPA: FtsX-like permease family protein [Actinomycetota bacterium]|nr:FtsX-like permease family protein [Actinomycetota bacterium]